MKKLLFPAVHTLAARALAKLLAGERISHREFQNKTATYRLSGQIYILRDGGWPIHDQWHEEKTADPAVRRARYKRYFLKSEDIQKAGKRAREFIDSVERWERKRTKGAATPEAASNVQKNDSRGFEQ